MFILPTKEDADFIVSNSKQFFRKDDKFLDKDVFIYHYKQAKFEEFEKFKEKGSYELRGLTFIENKRFLSLHKFFELNQAPGWMEEDLKDKKIIKATEKIDGTLLQPILINNNIHFKTKLSFNAYQATRATTLINKNPKLKEYILKKFNQNKIPIFEFISPKTQVVIDYKKEELFLIQVRDLKTGEYELNFEEEAHQYNIRTPKNYPISNLKEFLELAQKEHTKEGWVLVFEGMQFVKIKTKEYLKLHNLIAKIQPHEIIKAILEKKDKEYEEVLNKNSQKYEEFKKIKTLFLKKYTSLKKETQKAIKLSKKQLKKRYSNHPYYELFAYCKNKGMEVFDEWIKQHTSKLKGAKKFLEL